MQTQSPSPRHTCPMSHGHSVTFDLPLLASEASLLKQRTTKPRAQKSSKASLYSQLSILEHNNNSSEASRLKGITARSMAPQFTENITRTFHAKPHSETVEIFPCEGLDTRRNVVHLRNAHREQAIGENYQDEWCDSPAQYRKNYRNLSCNLHQSI